MTVNAMLRDLRALREARRIYDRAVERHFVQAHRLVAEGKPDAAERVAKGAAALRVDAHCELAER
jgi:hypothetical protein